MSLHQVLGFSTRKRYFAQVSALYQPGRRPTVCAVHGRCDGTADVGVPLVRATLNGRGVEGVRGAGCPSGRLNVQASSLRRGALCHWLNARRGWAGNSARPVAQGRARLTGRRAAAYAGPHGAWPAPRLECGATSGGGLSQDGAEAPFLQDLGDADRPVLLLVLLQNRGHQAAGREP